MTEQELEKIKYPLGRFKRPGEINQSQVKEWIEEIETLPKKFRNTVENLPDAKLETSYREGGWTLRQITHHVPDSHLNSYIRFKLAMSENNPTIKPYDENVWAEHYDAKHAPIAISLAL